MMAGLGLILMTVVVVGFIAYGSRISSDTGNDLTKTGFATQKRNACVSDLRNESDYARGEVVASVLNRLIILDGKDPETGKSLPRYTDETGKTVIDKDVQDKLADEYVMKALVAREDANAASEKLLQPALNNECGKPILDEEDLKKDGN